MSRLCAFPGCDAALYLGNVSGVCRAHNHAQGLCQCFDCTGVVPTPPVSSREGVRVAEVPYPTSNSGVALKAKVSLPKEPWA